MNDELLQKYIEVRSAIDVLESDKRAIEEQLFEAFDEKGDNFAEFQGYQIVRMSRKSYEYSERVVELTKELSMKKKIEEMDGTAALKKDSQYIRLIKAKEEHDNA